MNKSTLTTKTNKYTAVNYLLYLLSKRDYSEQELRRKLQQKEYNTEEIEQAIEKAQSNNWQSDERFCWPLFATEHCKVSDPDAYNKN